MNFNLTELSVALSRALDFLELDFLSGMTYHSKRVAYIALRLGELRGLPPEELSDLVTLAILHDNGLGPIFQRSLAVQGLTEASDGRETLSQAECIDLHCTVGEENLADYPFLSRPQDVIRYHHENWDGTGSMHAQGEGIPLMARLIRIADSAEMYMVHGSVGYGDKRELQSWLEGQKGGSLDPSLVEAFREASSSPSFWLDLENDFVSQALLRRTPSFAREISVSELRQTVAIFSRIIDSKSRFTLLHSKGVSEKVAVMARRYGFDADTIAELRIAADLHDLGKLAVSNSIIDKAGPLEPSEFDAIQRHAYYTWVSLQSIGGFERITRWAATHHEKLDGSGYPFGLGGDQLDFNSRLLCCLDIYQALTEERPYRAALDHPVTIGIMRQMVSDGKIDAGIVEDIDKELRE